MARGLSVAAVVAVGWAVAILLLYQGLRMGLQYAYEPAPTIAGIEKPTIAAIMFYLGMALIPASPAAAAWLSARCGWTVAARILGGLAAIIALIIGVWATLTANA